MEEDPVFVRLRQERITQPNHKWKNSRAVSASQPLYWRLEKFLLCFVSRYNHIKAQVGGNECEEDEAQYAEEIPLPQVEGTKYFLENVSWIFIWAGHRE